MSKALISAIYLGKIQFWLGIFSESWRFLGQRLGIFLVWAVVLAACVIQQNSFIQLCQIACLVAALVYIPVLLCDCISWLLSKIIDHCNKIACRKRMQNILKHLVKEPGQAMSHQEKNKVFEFLKRSETVEAVWESIRSGYKGVVFLKKAYEKPRSVRGTENSNKENPPVQNRVSHHVDSSFACLVDERLPRKIVIEFIHKKSDNCIQKIQDSQRDYLSLVLQVHILHKRKLAGGGKDVVLSKKKTAVGAFTVCEYSEAWSSDTLGRKDKVLLRKRADNESLNGILHSYRVDESYGESLSRYIARLACIKQDIQPQSVLDFIAQVQKQLEKLHQRNYAHMDLKPENIAVALDENQKMKFTVIDYPDTSTVIEKKGGRSTPWFGQMSNIHGLLSQVIIHNKYVFYVDCETDNIVSATVSDKHRRDFEALIAKFENRKPREIKENTSPSALIFPSVLTKKMEQYIPVMPSTIFHDTWALLYVAFIMSGSIGDNGVWQTNIFLQMHDMFEDYARWWEDKDGFTDENKAKCITYMNQKWSLESVLKNLKRSIQEQQAENPMPAGGIA